MPPLDNLSQKQLNPKWGMNNHWIVICKIVLLLDKKNDLGKFQLSEDTEMVEYIHNMYDQVDSLIYS